MNRFETDNEVMDAAIEAMFNETGLRLGVVKDHARKDSRRLDAMIQMEDHCAQFVVKVKKWAAQAHIGSIINQIRNLAAADQGLLVADYINPNMCDRLKHAGIQFIDTAGNAYINHDPVYISIKGNKPQQRVFENKSVKTGKAFQPSGIKVVFAFIRDKLLINAPYREIADQAGVALGTVGCVIHDLIEQGFLLEDINGKQRKLARHDLLVDQWADAYLTKLKRKHKIATFTTSNPDWWKTVDPQKYDANWGGEIAASIYTNYMNPKNGVVYINRVNVSNFLQAARLQITEPHVREYISIDMIKPFWKKSKPIGNAKLGGLVHPIIAYADLIEISDTRNLDTAKELREEYLREDNW